MPREQTPAPKPFLPLLLGGVLAASVAGCGGGGPKLIPVEGKVTLGDKPLTSGYVVLKPDASRGNTSMEVPTGTIDAQGNYTISTGAKTGAAPGWYKVAVTAAADLDPNNPYFTKWLVPERYIEAETSKLAIEVVEKPAAGAYDFTLDPK
jgi:hypothetical protein